MIVAFLIALFATPFPAPTKTSWMTPLAFHLTIGMPREKAMATLKSGMWKSHPGKAAGQVVVDYSDSSSVTLDFAHERLASIRFELFAFFDEVKSAFHEQSALLRAQEGPPRKLKSDSILMYDQHLPNIMVVMSTDRKTQLGRQGVGFVTVRYFAPPAAE